MSCPAGGVTVALNSGHSIPAVGLGVYQAEHGDEAYEACLHALKIGYRHIDTAQIYRNEGSVGRAIKDSGIPREQIFVTTKFWCQAGHGRENAVAKLNESLALLMLTYVDLYAAPLIPPCFCNVLRPALPLARICNPLLMYLMHSPGSAGPGRADSWAGMQDCVAQGLAKSIGVSNYGVEHLKALEGFATIVPAVNQIELSPWRNCAAIVAQCKAMGTIVQAYSPLTKGRKLEDQRLVAVAAMYGKTPAQILIRYGIDQGWVTLPKSTTPSRIESNFAVFDFKISAEDIAMMQTWEEGLVTGWDPTVAP